MYKKGLSQVVSAMILIVITLAAAVILATSTSDFAKDKLDKSQSCFELFNKVKINDEYTCYNLTNKIMQVSIIREDVELESILVAIRMDKSSFNFRLEEDSKVIPLVQNYPSNSTGVNMSGKQSAKTYIVEGINEMPLKIEVAPKTEKTQCQAMDSLEAIPVC